MRVWMEVSSEYRFERKIAEEEGLCGPATKRHMNQLKDVVPGDVILHYIILPGTSNKYKASVIGISKAKSEVKIHNKKLGVDIGNLHKIPTPIQIRKIKELDKKTDKLGELLKVNFQRYLGEIAIGDLERILKIYPENFKYVANLEDFANVFN